MKRSSAAWMSQVVAICGYWEPLAFLRRRGTTSVNDAQEYAAAHTEAMAEALSERGINAVIWHGFKGFGLEIEKAEMEATRRFAAHCRARGITVGAYCNFGTFFAETMFLENPEAREWPATDAFGQPQPYSEFYRSTYRYRPCMTHDSYARYVERAALYLIEHVGAQWVHFDNNAAVPCYTERFLEHYRRHLASRYRTDTPEGRARFQQRFGFPTPEHVVLPRGTARMPLDTLAAAQEPNLQEWIDYRCSLLTGAYRSIVDTLRAKHPEVVLDLNPPLHRGEFVPLAWGVDVDGLSTHGDMMYAEDGLEPRVGAAGQVIGNFANYKFGRAVDQRIIVHSSGSPLDLMEAAVHNRGCLGRVAWGDALPAPESELVQTIRFIRRHEPLFVNTRTMADVAVLRGRSALINNWSEAWQSLLMVWQTLARYGIQWDTVLERSLGDLSRYRLLILPNTISLGDESMRRITAYVEAGGRVLGLEQAGQCDAWGRSRIGPVELLDAETDEGLGTFRPRRVNGLCKLLSLTGDAASRVAHVPELVSGQKWKWDPRQSWQSWIGVEHWRLPDNASDVVAAIRQALGGRILACHDQPSYVGVQLLRDAEGVAVHLLNYQAPSLAEPMRLRVGLGVREARTMQLHDEDWQPIPVAADSDGGTTLDVPGFRVWRAIRLEGVDGPEAAGVSGRS